jgi:hypothetical protein
MTVLHILEKKSHTPSFIHSSLQIMKKIQFYFSYLTSPLQSSLQYINIFWNLFFFWNISIKVYQKFLKFWKINYISKIIYNFVEVMSNEKKKGKIGNIYCIKV